MNKKWIRVFGLVAIILGTVALFISGVGQPAVTAIIGAVFVLAGIIAAIFKTE